MIDAERALFASLLNTVARQQKQQQQLATCRRLSLSQGVAYHRRLSHSCACVLATHALASFNNLTLLDEVKLCFLTERWRAETVSRVSVV